MNWTSIFRPSRRMLNPVLADDPVMERDADATDLFLDPMAQRIAEHIGLVIALSSGACLLTAWLIHAIGGESTLALYHLFTFLGFVIAGLPALETVRQKLSRLRIDVDVLMLVGATLAAWIGSPFEGAILLFLFALSGGLEEFALRRTQSSILSLRSLSPREATLLKDDSAVRIPLSAINVGDRVLVRPGEKIPVDGTVLAGETSVDESAITGESIPRDCHAGGAVFAGTQNLNGRIEVRVTRRSTDTALARIVELVTEARQHPSSAQRLIDRIGPAYSISVVAGSILVGLAAALVFNIESGEAVRRGIAVLIVASPCALIIATPVAYLSAIARSARNGVLIKGGAHLEVLAKARAVLFDKTGTLTTGKIRLTDIVMDPSLIELDALRWIGALEQASNHPLASAVNRALAERGIPTPAISEYTSLPGQGARGVVEGRSVWIGRPEHLPQWVGESPARAILERAAALRAAGKTVSAVAIEDRPALLAFEDTLRDGAVECIRALRAQGVERLEMLTGDHAVVAAHVAGLLALDGFRAALLPDQKVAAIHEIRRTHAPVVLVGDGINDAPALAHADVGIAMGSMGADVSLDAAHIVLMKDRLDAIAWLHRHARRTTAIVRQNIVFAVAVISILGVFSAMGSIPLPLAVVGHEGSTILVALNALRLLRSDERSKS